MVRPLAPLLVYYTNYDYIASELCENRDKPYLECNGICYLDTMMKKIEPESKDKEPKSTVLLNMSDYPISTLDFFEYESPFQEEFKEKLPSFFNKDFIISEYNTAIFHPPEEIS